ncbi:MAG: SIS domain-containing protein [Sedimenticola sp.]
MNPKALLIRSLESSISAKQAFLQDEVQLNRFTAAIEAIAQAYRAGGRLCIAGNGGSAADAQHLAAELVCRLSRDRAPLAAEAFTVDSSILTAIANDYGYEKIFSRQVEANMSSRDVFLAISTSGNSGNIVDALEKCRELGITSVLISGRDGGSSALLADHVILAKGKETTTIQEQHIIFVHSLCASLEATLLPPSSP